MTIVQLCREQDLAKERSGYARAFQRRGVRLACIESEFPLDGDVAEILRSCPERPALILHPECLPLLPWGLAGVDVPTACFHVDTYAYTSHRISCSMLFDMVFVFHPKYDVEFHHAGHPEAYVVPHAIDASLFSGDEAGRRFEIGWVGQTHGPLYRTREFLLPELSRSFRMNDLTLRYTEEEMARTYLQSRIVVNIPRDDFPQDANLRVFEAMGAGALLLTPVPSELTHLGFEEGAHFVGYRDPSDVAVIVRRYLGDEAARQKISTAARVKVMREHTYDCRVEILCRLVEQNEGRLCAPARKWPEARVRRTYLDYFAGHNMMGCATSQLRAIAAQNLKDAALGLARLTRAWARQIQRKAHAHVSRE